MVKKLQVIIARYAKKMANAASCQSVQQIVGHGIGVLHDSFPSDVDIMLSIKECRWLSSTVGMKAWKTMFTAANSKSRIPPGECNRIHYLFTPQGERS
ncbi:hypothetical protein A676_04137 [Salmonella enterica subsp. enterica serovar Enteritidis str. 2010K-0262]|uniref:Uncharacterized protein n=3 Tax=Salmonella enterica TaxID=28901 RepID=A0A656IKK1_SALE2|nr:hypothetical protein A672_04708 [Salmonella enterica subsp. enterica serovar Enteritidis str. 08-1080]EPI68987.1 hypothetical protein A673_02623 [Salmonella enterica subsp. enterica serovar Enteritidis str. 2009K0958]EPI78046.1 hypothetical protein A675_05072 [Salmonella enterica subsp. enterica serovar Enteritidis str. 2009K1726]EPI80059.1 hypothetical protein A676_04137 [Salmonella enterica subsp. enterica serovar Enteritidis str. 2010K-0262]EPI81903.1 hypothetical protein A674_04255 [Salm